MQGIDPEAKEEEPTHQLSVHSAACKPEPPTRSGRRPSAQTARGHFQCVSATLFPRNLSNHNPSRDPPPST
ncbi:hypothetical protein L6164_033995 [Bauhinia variegata]|uniref:Uncharacterized protein n=1 Tax=Bauhinia variegata TaxID=167791 RepID=A0ACB9KTP1_BAUVA|nr:hypothetical protein L6164_033995 [Bauhinia variegata]